MDVAGNDQEVGVWLRRPSAERASSGRAYLRGRAGAPQIQLQMQVAHDGDFHIDRRPSETGASETSRRFANPGGVGNRPISSFASHNRGGGHKKTRQAAGCDHKTPTAKIAVGVISLFGGLGGTPSPFSAHTFLQDRQTVNRHASIGARWGSKVARSVPSQHPALTPSTDPLLAARSLSQRPARTLRGPPSLLTTPPHGTMLIVPTGDGVHL